ncbi:MAG: histidine ammonia-lyase [Planctomycetota bacterium]
MTPTPAALTLTGSSLTIDDLVRVSRDPQVRVVCDPAAMTRVQNGWKQTEAIGKHYAEDPTDPKRRVYGVTTGFGEFKDKAVSPAQLQELQRNILLSHAVGVGENTDVNDPSNYYSGDIVRGALVLRLNTFLRGHSGVSPELVSALVALLNLRIIPRVPLRGSVGSSGDLCPLCHTFIVMLGEGEFYIANDAADLKIRGRQWSNASTLPKDARYEPRWKEGIALSNGAAYSAAILAMAVHDSEIVATTADVAAALTLEAMCGRTRAFYHEVHETRGMRGQIDVAENLLNLTNSSKLIDRAASVQDPYSLRCSPQVHGASRDTIAYAKMVAQAEINAVTDNPLFFNNQPGAFSQGNFHGQPVALAADFLAIALAEFASISERRTQMLLDAAHNRNLPGNLISKRGVQSGLMIAQYTAASLVSENKVLAHPASVDSIPTSANSEDHNSMATIAARKLRTVLNNVQATIGIELLAAAQGIDWRITMRPDPNNTDKTDSTWDAALAEAKEFEQKTSNARRNEIASELGRGTRAAYLCIREKIQPMTKDKVLAEDVRIAHEFVVNGEVASAAGAAIEHKLNAVAALLYSKR